MGKKKLTVKFVSDDDQHRRALEIAAKDGLRHLVDKGYKIGKRIADTPKRIEYEIFAPDADG